MRQNEKSSAAPFEVEPAIGGRATHPAFHCDDLILVPQKRPRTAAVKDFSCPIGGCERNFYHKRNLRRHLKQNHSLMEMSGSGFKVTF